METTHIVTMKVERRSGTTYYNFGASYSAGQVNGKIAFGFMKVADSLDESDLNLFLFPENDRIMIYQYGSTYQGKLTKIGQVDGETYYGILDDGGRVEFNIESVDRFTGQEEYADADYDEEEEEEEDYEVDSDEDEEDETPVAHIDGKHLKFKNIPIDGTLDEFCAQLDGYELVGSDEYDRVYTGQYAKRDATLYISANPETGMVYRVLVEVGKRYMDCDTDVSDVIMFDYDEILNAFKKKYGEEYAEEQDDYEYTREDEDGYQEAFMQEIADGDSTIGANFQFESDESQWYSKVTIYVEFSHTDDEGEEDPDNWYGCVNIGFVDGENEPFPEEDEDESDEEDEDEDGEIDIDEL